MFLITRIFSLDLRSIALFRVLLGSLLLCDLLLRSVDLSDFYTDAGVLPRHHLLSISSKWYWSLHAAGGELWWQILLFTIAGVAAFALIAGYRSKLAAVVSFVLLASLLNRNGLILQGGDQLLVVMCFWSIFLPLGARYSFDASLIPEFQHNPNSDVGQKDVAQNYFSVATIAIVFQILYLYIFTAIMKTGDAWLVRFDAAFYAVSLQQFATPIAEWIKQFPTLLGLATRYVIAVEFVAPLLVLCPFFWPWIRLTGLFLLASLHVAFLLMLHIGLFPFIDFMALSLLVPGAAWAMVKKKNTAMPPKKRLNSIRLYYDEDCGFCLKMCLILRTFLLSSSTEIQPAQRFPDIYSIMEKENSWVVTDENNQPHIHWHAMVLLFSARTVFKPIAWIMSFPPFLWAGNKSYRWVANNRGLMGTLSLQFIPFRSLAVKPTILGSLAAALMFYVVTSYNVYGLPNVVHATPAHVVQIAKTLRVDQRWDMFAPYPLTNSIYLLMPGELRDGTVVNLYPKTSDDASWKRPDRYYSLYDGYRWRKYYGRVSSHKNNAVRKALGSYLCKAWNDQQRPTDTQLVTFEIHFVKHRTNTENLPKKESRHRAWRHWCYPEFADK
jgi:predicted DCC family thiol-disulfide oxidoreductase YuxK